MGAGKRAIFLDLDGTIITTNFGEKPKPVFKGLPKWLDALRSKGISLFIVTSRSTEIQKDLIGAGIDPRIFTEIKSIREIEKQEFLGYCNNNWERLEGTGLKIGPGEEFILKAISIEKLMKKHNLKSSDVLMIGDEPTVDARAARLVGVQHGNVMDKYKDLPTREQAFVNRRREPEERYASKQPSKKAAKKEWRKTKAVRRFLG